MGSLQRKIFFGFFISSFFLLVICTMLFTSLLYYISAQQVKKELAIQAHVFTLFSDINIDDLARIPTKNRLTLIASDGTVLYDNRIAAENMENHIDRFEVQSANEFGIGIAVRNSQTLSQESHYYAVKLLSGKIIRVSTVTKSLFASILQALEWFLPLLPLVFFLSLVVSHFLTKKIINPINQVDTSLLHELTMYDEFSPFVRKIAAQNRQIEQQLQDSQAKQQEFSLITQNMNEALVLFSKDKTILFANEAARKIFVSAKIDSTYLHISREADFIAAIESAFLGEPKKIYFNHHVRKYEIMLTPVKNPLVQDNSIFPVVLLGIDISEKEQSEKLRKEFSANVSHELKTPLTNILGYSEIIRDGLAKPEDILQFIERVYQNAEHLLHLIDDIITISQLDENKLQSTFQNIAIVPLIKKIHTEATLQLQEKNITVVYELDYPENEINVLGNERLLYDLFRNIFDNAVMYNTQNGKITVRMQNTDTISVQVADTGIGIARQDQARIFERFYRVDKSRSRESGGTGLGLAIVKHIALIHHARIQLTSELNKGTQITIMFPNQRSTL